LKKGCCTTKQKGLQINDLQAFFRFSL